MKRKREMEKGSSEIRSAIDELSLLAKLQSEARFESPNDIPTLPFLSLSNLILHVLDKIGPTMAVLRQDIHQNIQRIEKEHEYDPSAYSSLLELLKKESNDGNARKGNSCSKAIVWLTRSLDFTAELLKRSTKDSDVSMEQAVEDSYNLTLKPWHGWISSAAFKIALKLVPDTKTFINLLMEKYENYESFVEEIHTMISLLLPFLHKVHSVLILYGLDGLKCA